MSLLQKIITANKHNNLYWVFIKWILCGLQKTSFLFHKSMWTEIFFLDFFFPFVDFEYPSMWFYRFYERILLIEENIDFSFEEYIKGLHLLIGEPGVTWSLLFTWQFWVGGSWGVVLNVMYSKRHKISRICSLVG